MEYVKALERRNRQKKVQPETTKKFELHWAGANAGKKKETPPQQVRQFERRRTWDSRPTERHEDYESKSDEEMIMKATTTPRENIVVSNCKRKDSSRSIDMDDIVAVGKTWKNSPPVIPHQNPQLRHPFDEMLSRTTSLTDAQRRIIVRLVADLDACIMKSETDADAAVQCADVLRTMKKPLPLKKATPRRYLRLRIKDGWGSPRIAGLDGVQILTGENTMVPLEASDVSLFAGSPPRPAPPTSRSAAELPRLLSPENSWIVRLPSDGPVEVVLQLPDIQAGTLRLINCTASPDRIDAIPTKEPGILGAKNIHVLIGDNVTWCLMWSGLLPMRGLNQDSGILDIPFRFPSNAHPSPASSSIGRPSPHSSFDRGEKPPGSSSSSFESNNRGGLVLSVETTTTTTTTPAPAVASPKPIELEEPASPILPSPPASKNPLSPSPRRSVAKMPPPSPERPRSDDVKKTRRPRSSLEDDAAAKAPMPPPASAEEVPPPREQPPKVSSELSKVVGPDTLDQVTSSGTTKKSPKPVVRVPRASQDALQQSWESLSLFKRMNRSRLSEAGASILSGGFPPRRPPEKDKDDDDDDKTPHQDPFQSFADSIVDSSPCRTQRKLDPGPKEEEEQPNVVVHPKRDDTDDEEEDVVEIPTLPTGRILRFELLSTWGDEYYIGLHGIEVFDAAGKPITPKSIIASPPSINVLPEYDSDPRTADKLIDGVPCTCDELHSWLAPYDKGNDHYIDLELGEEPVTLAMLRVWNYNKSRAHSYRGARTVRGILDGVVIFSGEIQKAPGGLEGAEMAAETILFTTDETILQHIEDHDVIAQSPAMDDLTTLISEAQELLKTTRPTTAEEDSIGKKQLSYREMLAEEGMRWPVLERPRTSTSWRSSDGDLTKDDQPRKTIRGRPRRHTLDCAPGEETPQEDDDADRDRAVAILEGASSTTVKPTTTITTTTTGGTNTVVARKVSLRLLATWGDEHYIGLSGLHIYSSATREIPITTTQLSATPRDLRSLGYVEDPRTLEKLVDGVSRTTEDEHIWLVPFSKSAPPPRIDVDMDRPRHIWGIGVYNYNKSPEDTLRGVRLVAIDLDDKPWGVAPLRPAPGREALDFQQRIPFSPPPAKPPLVDITKRKRPPEATMPLTDYETLELPSGSLFRFVIHGNFGDPYYVGLDAIEIRDHSGVVEPALVVGVPDSVRVLGPGFQKDSRLPANLFSTTSTPWLAPTRASLDNNDDNELFVFFDSPVTVATVTFWNYTKTPSRGVRDLSLWLDGCIVARTRLTQGVTGQHLSFTKDRPNFGRPRQDDLQDVLCIDDNHVRVPSKAMYDTNVAPDGVFSRSKYLQRPTTTSLMA